MCFFDLSWLIHFTTLPCCTNTADVQLMVYHRVSDAIRRNVSSLHPVPLRALVDFDRITLAKGAGGPLGFTTTDSYLTLTDAQGRDVTYAGDHYIDITNGNGNPLTFTINVPAFSVVRKNSL